MLVGHLRPLLVGKTIRGVSVRRDKVVRPSKPNNLARALRGARVAELSRRGKYIVFHLQTDNGPLKLVGHLGMTGRMWLTELEAPLPKHAAVVLNFDSAKFVFEDTRYFGRLSLDTSPLARLGPEPLDSGFTAAYLRSRLKASRQAIKVKLLDQRLVAGIGNIYASEALHRAGISPNLPATRLRNEQVRALWRAIRAVLRGAVRYGSTVPLNFGSGNSDGFFYYGRAQGTPDYYEEKLRVYGRENQPCPKCGARIRRRVQAARSTFYCPNCQH